jgi:hypothetical protein
MYVCTQKTIEPFVNHKKKWARKFLPAAKSTDIFRDLICYVSNTYLISTIHVASDVSHPVLSALTSKFPPERSLPMLQNFVAMPPSQQTI